MSSSQNISNKLQTISRNRRGYGDYYAPVPRPSKSMAPSGGRGKIGGLIHCAPGNSAGYSVSPPEQKVRVRYLSGVPQTKDLTVLALLQKPSKPRFYPQVLHILTTS